MAQVGVVPSHHDIGVIVVGEHVESPGEHILRTAGLGVGGRVLDHAADSEGRVDLMAERNGTRGGEEHVMARPDLDLVHILPL